MKFDVAIIGGGPAGSTCGSFLRKYKPTLKVGIFEREKFPRDHIGESQLPSIGRILAELGVWDKVEAADFPVKIGATLKWGISDELWDFHFLPNGEFHDESRPAEYKGQRLETAFQVDRSIYDKILLDHARELGCDVFEEAPIREVRRDGDTVESLIVKDGAEVQARHYVDATGHVGFLRRAMGVQTVEPSTLRNVAFWEYWQNAEWAVTIGIGGTRIQIMSVGYGWLWFIPLGPTRSSLGFVCPADYYKKSGLTPEQLYEKAIRDEPRISALLENAEPEGNFGATKDWSFVAERMTGANWMLVGESCGFADPVLSAGLSITHAAAREAAFTILEMDRGGNRSWLTEQYANRNRRRVAQHIRFADFWYAGNKNFSELREYTSEIARDVGLDLDPESAFKWLGAGGFIDDDIGIGGLGAVGLGGLHQITKRLSGDGGKTAFGGFNGFVLNVAGANKIQLPHYEAGRVLPIPAYSRDGKILPLSGLFGYVVKSLEHSPRILEALTFMERELRTVGVPYTRAVHDGALECLEALVRDGWVEPRKYKTGEALPEGLPDSSFFQTNRDEFLPKGVRTSRSAKAT